MGKSHKKREQINTPGFYHLYARTADGKQLFLRQSDFKTLLSVAEDARRKVLETRIIIMVCMSNHFHMIVYSPDIMAFKTYIGRKYCGWYNTRHNRRGALLEDSTIKASRLPYREAIRDKILYNANNPVKAGICKTAWGYKYSSLRIFTKRPWVWKSLITVDDEYLLNLFGDLDNFREALRREKEYKDILKQNTVVFLRDGGM